MHFAQPLEKCSICLRQLWFALWYNTAQLYTCWKFENRIWKLKHRLLCAFPFSNSIRNIHNGKTQCKACFPLFLSLSLWKSIKAYTSLVIHALWRVKNLFFFFHLRLLLFSIEFHRKLEKPTVFLFKIMAKIVSKSFSPWAFMAKKNNPNFIMFSFFLFLCRYFLP